MILPLSFSYVNFKILSRILNLNRFYTQTRKNLPHCYLTSFRIFKYFGELINLTLIIIKISLLFFHRTVHWFFDYVFNKVINAYFLNFCSKFSEEFEKFLKTSLPLKNSCSANGLSITLSIIGNQIEMFFFAKRISKRIFKKLIQWRLHCNENSQVLYELFFAEICENKPSPWIFLLATSPVMHAGFFGWWGSAKCLGGSDFSKVELNFTIGRRIKICITAWLVLFTIVKLAGQRHKKTYPWKKL